MTLNPYSHENQHQDSFVVKQTEIKHAKDCETIQRHAYPGFPVEELFNADHVTYHTKLFPDGQFVVEHVPSGRAVGMCSGFITCFEEASYDGHTFDEAISGGWLTRHNPDCTHYYGVDISILPEFRGRGLARLLYEARKNCCRKLNLKGIVINGIMPGFAKHKHALSAQAYIQHVIAGQIHDPTVSVQLRNGFSPIKLMANHFHDSATAGWAMLMEWRNPDYSPDLIKIKTPHRHRIREPHLV